MREGEGAVKKNNKTPKKMHKKRMGRGGSAVSSVTVYMLKKNQIEALV